jgi:hypothetical protein
VATALQDYLQPAPVLREVARVLSRGGEHLVAVSDSGPAAADDPIGRILRPMRRGLGRADVADALESVAACCRDLGLTCRVEKLPPRSYQRSPAREARDIMDRASSVLWDVDDATWNEVVRPAVRELLALPDAERPLTRHASYLLVIITADGQQHGAAAG